MSHPAIIALQSEGRLFDFDFPVNEEKLSNDSFPPYISPSDPSSLTEPTTAIDWEAKKDALFESWYKISRSMAHSRPPAQTHGAPNPDLSPSTTNATSPTLLADSNRVVDKKLVFELRDKRVQDHMARTQGAGRLLQRALGIFDNEPWPHPPTSRQVPDFILQAKANEIRSALIVCGEFAVEMDRKSENLQFADRSILAFYDKKHEVEAKLKKVEISKKHAEDQRMLGGVEGTPDNISTMYFQGQQMPGGVDYTPDTVMTDIDYTCKESIGDDATPNNDNHPKLVFNEEMPEKTQSGAPEASIEENTTSTNLDHQKAVHDEAAPGNFKTKDTSSGAPTKSGEFSSKLPAPDPTKMRGTFFNAICHQRDIHAKPILTLTLMDDSTGMKAPTAQRCELLIHFEVGLDGVEALCRGFVEVEENSYWKENILEKRVGKLGTVKAGVGGHSKMLEREQIKKGLGQGLWMFYGVKFQPSKKQRKKGKEGKWACFGMPVEAVRPGMKQTGTAELGGGVNLEGNKVHKHQAKVTRESFRLSIGGVACMDLWEGAEQWERGVWEEVRHAMACNTLMLTFLR